MRSLPTVMLFELALVVPPLVIVVGMLMLVLPSRSRKAEHHASPAHAS